MDGAFLGNGGKRHWRAVRTVYFVRVIPEPAAMPPLLPSEEDKHGAGRALEDLHGQTAHKRDIARAQGKARP
jgi:hypothetical protein